MRCDRRSVLLALAATLLRSTSAAGQRPPDPSEPIRLLEAALAGMAGGLPTPAAVRSAVDRSFDTREIARAVLAGEAGNATTSQLERFRNALVERIARDLLNRRRADGRGILTILRTRAIGAGDWLVNSTILVPGTGQRAISWRVHTNDRGTLIYDVLGSGTTMVRALRGEHLAALRRLGLDGLIARMEARNRRTRN